MFPSSDEGRETPTLSGPLERGNVNHYSGDPTVYVSPFTHLKTVTDPVSETFCFLVFRIWDDGQCAETQ
jgi:hypothetical protein